MPDENTPPSDPDLTITHPRARARMVLGVVALAGLVAAAWFGWQHNQLGGQSRGQSRGPNASGPIRANDLQGTWAWLGEENCEAFFRTLSFAGDRIYAREDGQGLIDVRGAGYALMPGTSTPTVSVTYALGGNRYEAHYRFISRAKIALVDDLKNGSRNDAIDRGRGRTLVRCKTADPMPDIGTAVQPFDDSQALPQ